MKKDKNIEQTFCNNCKHLVNEKYECYCSHEDAVDWIEAELDDVGIVSGGLSNSEIKKIYKDI